ncbi:MAG TPA: NUDIX hydrolase [Baekduia sp.]|nr:NUDIX hydrolase [Baekduia sp.]
MIEAAGGLIVGHDGRVAVVHRSRYDDWSLPKGKLEEGESFEDAALREIEEECDLRCRLLDELPSNQYRVSKGEKLVRWWRMEVVEDLGFKPDDEVDELRWLTPGDAIELVDYSHDKLLLGLLP